jgi:hypothetical protein
MALEREIEAYRKNLSELLAHKGRFVLIHHEDVIGIFDGFEDALRAGYEKWLNEPFLVRRINDTEKVFTVSRNLHPCPMSPVP